MELILLEKVQNLGNLGDVVNVKPGFGRNFLLPSGKAARATKTNLAAFEEKRIELEKKAEDKLMASKARATDLEGVEIKMSLNSSDEGKLYGSVGAREIAEALTELGHPVQKPEVILPEGGAVRLVGEYDVILHLHADVNVSVHLVIEGES